MNRRRFRRCFGAALFFATLLIALSVQWAAAGPWPALDDPIFFPFERESELGGSAAITFAQDRDGYVWIGTEGGLARFDGYHARRYSADPTDADSLPDVAIEALFVDAGGRLWVGTQAGGLAAYDSRHDRFVRYSLGRATPSSRTINSLADDGSGGLWIGTGAGLEHLAANARTIISVAWPPTPLASHPINVLLRDHRGTLWAGTHEGLYRRLRGAKTFARVVLPGTPTIWSLFEDHRGNIWIGTTKQGAYRLDPVSGAVRIVRTTDAGPRLETEAIPSMAEVRDDEVWLATYGEGIVTVDAESLRAHRVRHDSRVPTSLPADYVFLLAMDNARQLWAFTPQGICTYNPQTAITTLFGGTGRPNAVSDANIQSVAALADGRVWLGLAVNGVDIVDPARSTVTPVSAGFPADGQTDAIAQAPNGEVFLGGSAGLFRAQSDGRSVRRVDVPGRSATARTSALYASPDALWVGGFGLWELRVGAAGQSHAFERLPTAVLGDAEVDQIAAERGGRVLWLATRAGLVRFDTLSRRVERIEADPRNPTALSANVITSLIVDRRGRLWMGTLGGGIDVLADTAGPRRFRHIGTPQGLPHVNIDALIEDAGGDIWASTDNGLAVIDGKTLVVQALQRTQGVEISNYWMHSAARTPHGELVFGGAGGITVVRPDRRRSWPFRAPVVVTDVVIGEKPARPEQPFGPGGGSALTIPAGAHRFSVQFAALDYTAPAHNRYAYRLDGYDNDWIETDSDHRVATYTNLPPGDYQLRLRGSNRDGVWTLPDTVVSIRVIPTWHQTWWFIALAVAAGIGLLAGAVQFRTRYLRARERALADEIERRTLQLVESQRQLEALAYSDLLTGLPNRRMFNEEFSRRAAATPHGGGFALLLIDLDEFKHINDTFGHDAGDAVLLESGMRFKRAVRDTDCVVRLGGDEFAALVSNCDAPEVEEICRRIVAAFVPPIAFKDMSLVTSPSIGIALFPRDGDAQDVIYKAADLALYEAKRAGRNTWRWHSQPVA